MVITLEIPIEDQNEETYQAECLPTAEGAVNGLINILDSAGYSYEEIADALCVNCHDIEGVIKYLKTLDKKKENKNGTKK